VCVSIHSMIVSLTGSDSMRCVAFASFYGSLFFLSVGCWNILNSYFMLFGNLFFPYIYLGSLL
jgi:hypothetical protein